MPAEPAGADLRTTSHSISAAKTTVVIPVRNEGDRFRETYQQLRPYLPADAVIFVVYDSPDDTTVPVLQRIACEDSRVRPLQNGRMPGAANALRAGFEAAGDGPVIVVMGDRSDDPGIIPAMLALHASGAAVVCPSRYMPGGAHVGGPFWKRTMTRVAGWSLYRLSVLPVRDATNNFRLYDGVFLQNTPTTSTGFDVALELTLKAQWRGLRVVELPTVWRDRKWGASKFRLRWLVSGYAYWWLQGVSARLAQASRARRLTELLTR